MGVGGPRLTAVTRRSRLCVALLTALSLPALERAAWCDDVEALLRKGTDLRKEGRDREALETFQQAAKIRPLPRVTAQMALAEQALGLWIDADAHLTKALGAKDDPWIAKNHEALENALAVIGQHLGTIEIWGTPDGAEVVIDGKPVGRLPSVPAVRVASDSISLEVRAPGYVDLQRVLPVKLGGYAREHVELRPLSAAGQGPAALPNSAGATVGVAAGADLGAPGPEARPLYRRWWFWTAAGAVVVGAVVTTIVLAGRGTQSLDGCSTPARCTTTWQ